MRAAFIEQAGPPEVIRYGELPAPRPGPTDVLVDVMGTTVNTVDTLIRAGLYRTPMRFPFVVGRDLVGRVAEAGPEVAGFAVGDVVWCNSLGHGGRQGAAAELAVVPVERLYRVPAGAAPYDVVAVAHPAATAYLALFTHGRLRPGETVLVGGAAGSVGSALVEFATQAGARVVATAREPDFEYCRSLGADAVLDYRDLELPAHIADLAPNGVDLHIDTSGTNDLAGALMTLAHRGRVVVLAGARTTPVLPAASLYQKDASVVGFVISRATTSELAEAAAAVNRLLAAGRLRPRRVETRPLAEMADTHARFERGELRGRRVVVTTGSA